MKKLLMMIGAAAVAVGANADTYTDDSGVVWTFYTNSDTTDDGSTAASLSGDDKDSPCISKTAVVDAANIPWTFEKDGVNYTVTHVCGHAFYQCTGLTGTLAIPTTVKKIGRTKDGDANNHPFNGCTGLTGISSFGDGLTSNPCQGFFKGCTGLEGTLVIPDTFSRAFDNYAFDGCSKLTGIVVGSGTTQIGRLFGSNATSLKGVWVKGRPTVESGTQNYTSVKQYNTFQDSTGLRVVLFGKNTSVTDTSDKYGMLNGVTTAGCIVFAPANGKWSSFTLGEGGIHYKVYYGADQDLDLEIDEAAGTITAKVKTEAMLKRVLEAAPIFKSEFNLDTRIEVAASLDVADVSAVAGHLAADTLPMAFAVKTQAQLEKVLAVVPSTSLIAIDPTGATEKLVLPGDRSAWVYLPANGQYRKLGGLIISFR